MGLLASAGASTATVAGARAGAGCLVFHAGNLPRQRRGTTAALLSSPGSCLSSFCDISVRPRATSANISSSNASASWECSSSSRGRSGPRPSFRRTEAGARGAAGGLRRQSAFLGAWEGQGGLRTINPSFCTAQGLCLDSQPGEGRWRGFQWHGRRSVCPLPSVLSPMASLFGVGAPEALVIGVVALIVFGPKGLADVARNLGKTLRTFQPTIRELQEVTREFKNTLEQEIGLDDIRQTTPPPLPPTPTSLPPPPTSLTPPASAGSLGSTAAPATAADKTATKEAPVPYTAEEMARVTEEQINCAMEREAVSEEARRASEAAAWKGAPPTSTPKPPQTPLSSSSPPVASAPPQPSTNQE